MSKLFNIIGQSPFDALKKHMQISCKCVSLLAPFTKTILQTNWDNAAIIAAQISSLESKADTLKQDMRLNLHKGLYLPVPRVEILGLIKVQDRIPNLSEDIAGLILGRKIIIPTEIEQDFLKLLNQALDTCSMAEEAINELKIFFASGFSGNISDLLEKMLIKVAHMEHIADTCELNTRAGLLTIENDLDPIKVMFLYKLISLVGEIADAAESVSDRIALLLAN